MSFTPITNHFEQAQTRFLGQYSADPRWTGLVAGLMAPIQTLEDTIASLPASLRLKTATGQPLDDIGAFIGLARNGTTDETYRLLLMGQIIEDRSDGTLAALETAAIALFGAKSAQVRSAFMGEQPCAIYLEVGSPSLEPSLYPLVVGIFRKAISAAMQLLDVESYVDGDDFRFDGGTPGKGYGTSSDIEQGGQFSSSLLAD